MLRKSLRYVALAVLAAALVLTFTACGQKNYAKELAGTYDLYEIKGDNGATHEEIAKLETAGFALFINLNEDGTFDFVYVGTDFKGTWSTTDGKDITMKPNDSSVTMSECTYEDGKLTMTLYGDRTVFEKGSKKTVSQYVG